MAEQDPIGPTAVDAWASTPPASPATWIGDVPRGALNDQQRARSAAAYEAARMILGEDPEADEVIKVAAYIVTGRAPVLIQVGPSDSLIEEVISRVTRAARDALDRTGDAMSWSPRNVEPRHEESSGG